MAWYLDDNNKLTTDALPEPLDDSNGLFVEPYPASFWRFDSNNKLTINNEDYIAFPDYIPSGAFARCEQLAEVILPESLASIGEESFAESGLHSVTIPNNLCTYYATSFPPGCVVTGGHLIE